MSIVALVTDLLFATKIRSTADVLKQNVRTVRSAADWIAAAAQASLVIIDLNASGVDVIEAIREVRRLPSPPKILAYLSHVQQDLAAAAREAGADMVWPRSRFAEQLPSLLNSPTDAQ